MRKFLIVLLVLCIGFLGATGCLFESADSPEAEGRIRRGRPNEIPAGIRQVFAFYASAYYAETRGEIDVFAAELQNRIRAGELLYIIDVRDPASYQGGHIPAAVNIPIEELFTDEVMETLPLDGTPIIVVCANGQVGSMAAGLLGAMGYQAYVLRFGMIGWRKSTPVQFFSAQQFPQTINGLNGPIAQ